MKSILGTQMALLDRRSSYGAPEVPEASRYAPNKRYTSIATGVHRQNRVIPQSAFLWEPSRLNYLAAVIWWVCAVSSRVVSERVTHVPPVSFAGSRALL